MFDLNENLVVEILKSAADWENGAFRKRTKIRSSFLPVTGTPPEATSENLAIALQNEIQNLPRLQKTVWEIHLWCPKNTFQCRTTAKKQNLTSLKTKTTDLTRTSY